MKDISLVFTAVKLKDYKSGRVIWINVNKIIAIKETMDGHSLIICGKLDFHVQESLDEVMDIICGMYEEDKKIIND